MVYYCNCGLFQRPIKDCPTKKCKPPNKRKRAPKVLIKGSGDGVFETAMPVWSSMAMEGD